MTEIDSPVELVMFPVEFAIQERFADSPKEIVNDAFERKIVLFGIT